LRIDKAGEELVELGQHGLEPTHPRVSALRPEHVDERLADIGDHSLDEPRFGGEVVVDHAPADSGTLADLLHRQPEVALLGEDLHRRVQEPAPGGLSLLITLGQGASGCRGWFAHRTCSMPLTVRLPGPVAVPPT